jgi:glycerol uptake facilitator protein
MDCYYNRMGICRFVGVVVAGPVSGAHLNPIVTLGLALVGKFAWGQGSNLCAQLIGAMLGAFLVWLSHKDHATEDEGGKLACFSTGPAIQKLLF